MTKPWMIDELAHAGPEHLDPGFVAGFDRKQGYPDPAEDLAVLGEHGIGRASTMVDLGAGTGRFAVAAAAEVARVVAVNVSPAMQATLRERVARAGVPNVECVQAGFLTYEHSGPPADAVFTRNTLHQLPDFWKALALDRIARLLRPGGVLRLHDLIFDFQPAEAEAATWTRRSCLTDGTPFPGARPAGCQTETTRAVGRRASVRQGWQLAVSAGHPANRAAGLLRFLHC